MKCIVLLALVIGLLAQAAAQTKPIRALNPAPMEVTLAYSADRSKSAGGAGGYFWMQGAKAEANMAFGRGWSLVAELGGAHVSNVNAAGASLSMVTYLFGPRYSVRRWKRWTPFGQFLAGGVHGFDAYFPNSTGQSINPDAFAFVAGGGVNVRLSRHFGLRAVQADYLQTQLPNAGSNREDHFRVATGIVLRFPK
jgi:hypothetical protein